VLTLTPYDFSRHSHASHHANSRNLDHRGIGDVDTLTVREFLALSRWRQLLYRLYRHPIVMFGVDTAIEAVGVPASFIICEDIVAPGGIIASIGVHGVKADWHLERMLDRNIAITRRLVDTVSTPMLLGRHENTA
jgi:threonine dehydrogenase-like Zn-dependent dehydrogenase